MAIKSWNCKRKQYDYSNLVFENGIRPSDIDGIIEYKNKAYIIFDIKFHDSQLVGKQRRLFEVICNDLSHSGKWTVCAVIEDRSENYMSLVDASECVVREIYNSKTKSWHIPNERLTCFQFINGFFKKVDKT